jgi:hypothetical protein
MQPHRVSVGPLGTADADGIALSQALGAAGNLTLNGVMVSGGVATLDTPRRVALTSAGNDSAATWTVTGTDRSGITHSDSFAGANAGVVYSNLDFATVVSIALNAAAAGNVTAGTNTVASSQWARFDEYALGSVSVQCVADGTVSYTVEMSNDDPNSVAERVAEGEMSWTDVPAIGPGPFTTTFAEDVPAAPLFMRVTLASGTGSVRGVFVQHHWAD